MNAKNINFANKKIKRVTFTNIYIYIYIYKQEKIN